MSVKIISLDIFQTIVDVNQRIPQIWSRTLGSEFTMDRTNEGAAAIISALPEVMEQALHAKQHFVTMQEVYEECVQKALRHLSFVVRKDKIVECLLTEHAKAPFYEEALGVIEQLKKKYQIILCSDSNHIMVDEIIAKVCPSFAFISDDVKAYKADYDGVFFSKVLQTMNVRADELLHVGDSSYDIIGAERVGIPAVLIHRGTNPVASNIKPLAVISSLNQLNELL